MTFTLGVPLVLESFSWQHGVMVGACVKSESTAAAEHTGKLPKQRYHNTTATTHIQVNYQNRDITTLL